MSNETRTSLPRWLGGLTLVGGALIVAFWALYLLGAVELAGPDPAIRAFEAAFPIADALLAVALFAASVGLLRGRASGVFFLTAAAGMTLYLGLLDATFYGVRGLYAPADGWGLLEIGLNALCIVGGTLGLRFAWRFWRSAIVGRQPEPGSAGPVSAGFVRGYIVTMRPYLLFVSGITGLAGLALAPAVRPADVMILGLVFFLSYGFGQALTDCFQMDTDALSAPYRPLVRGEIRRRDVLVVSLMGLLASGLVLTLYSGWNLVLSSAAVAGLATYTAFKRRWWAGPFYNAWIVALLALIGYASGLGAGGGSPRATPVVLATLAAVFFGYANFVLAGYYKDISADRATGYRTLPVVFGLRVSTRISDLFAALTLAGCALSACLALAGTRFKAGHGIALVLLVAGAATALLAQTRLHGVRRESMAHRAIEPAVHAYILLLAGLASLQRPAWALPLVAFYLTFVLAMTRRPMRAQI